MKSVLNPISTVREYGNRTILIFVPSCMKINGQQSNIHTSDFTLTLNFRADNNTFTVLKSCKNGGKQYYSK